MRPGLFTQTHTRPDLHGRTLAEPYPRRDRHDRPRPGTQRRHGGAGPLRPRPGGAQPFETLSGGRQARLQILLLELSGATLLLLDEPRWDL
ncbi:hypothetical protein [Thermoactinospora rubra]|uniref:hypothetical protein n=1 Tax=Thermoactinospora rubra TaxID=1088767 RepID=UPI001981FBA1|nr:hypothetical protein [Thermoactinospora rubra]